MSTLQSVRGTHDYLPEEAAKHRRIEETAMRIAARYGFGEIITPIFEFTEVFARTLGETSDVVTKEMYTFSDRSGDSLTLRPEGTAGVARAFISGGLAQSLPLKLFYRGPMFRHERPQKGRLRQFHQIGAEFLGVAAPGADIEVVALGHHILTELGLGGDVALELNSLGDTASRAAYRDTLVAYLSARSGELSPESRDRLARNPMRVLDSKDEGDRAVVAEAPRLSDSLNDESRAFFDQVQDGLTRLGVPYSLNPLLVRGLDYYCHTAFEFTTTRLGAQGTVLAGGRYDGLIAQMGGPATPGIGWAAGVERLAMLAGAAADQVRPIAVIPVGEQPLAQLLAQTLRHAGFTVDLGYSGNLKKRLARAAKLSARAAVILGDDEVAAGNALLRDLDDGTQETVALSLLEDRLARYR